MQSLTKTRPAIYANIETLPQHVVGEILFGVLHTHPRPSPGPDWSSSAIGIEIGAPFQFGRGWPGGWVFIDGRELHLRPHVVVPDIAGRRKEQLPQLPDKAWIETSPDRACEVLSPSTQRADRTDKLAI